VKVYGSAVLEPTLLLNKVHNNVIVLIGALVFVVATVGVNIVANFVSPAYDLANVWPKYITFKRGGIITAFLALLTVPWKLYSSPQAISYFLGGLGALLGPATGARAGGVTTTGVDAPPSTMGYPVPPPRIGRDWIAHCRCREAGPAQSSSAIAVGASSARSASSSNSTTLSSSVPIAML